jgi:Mn2+/Fe2+ NRAMP family transporter
MILFVITSFPMCTRFLMLTGVILIVLYLVAMALLLSFISIVARFEHSFRLDLKNEYVWIEISVLNYLNLVIGNPYSLPNTDTKTIKQDLNSLEDI